MLWALAGTFLFSLVFASGKLTGGAIPALQIIFIRYLSGFAAISAAALVRGRIRGAIDSRRRPLHLLRGICGAGGGICAIHAATRLPLADATAIGLTAGMLAMILAVAILRERVSGLHWVAALACASGALIVAQGGSRGSGVGAVAITPAAWIALLGALLIASETVLLKVLSSRESAWTVLLHVNFFAALLLVGPALSIWQPMGWAQLGALGLLGPLALSGQYCNIRGYRLADAAFLAPYGYSWILFAAVIGWIAFGELPAATTLWGAVLIVAGGVALARLSDRRRRRGSRSVDLRHRV
ncbi:DMT family transporter [Rhodospirillaceae bacterium SYSU D60014]|uniref:DMT family transporter n=1 Tax=Virgifigura deserti TaxID=2268457 RepID=UPI0013C41318